ncbi:MAG: PAS domain-containing protein [Woeseiales bacterium]
MPEMCGTDFLKEVRARHPDTVRCILSGYAEMDSIVAAINDGNVLRFIAKPWDDVEIINVVSECLSVAEGVAEDLRDRESLENRATALEEESEQFEELFKLQETLLKSSRDVLDQLPIAVAALDAQGRMIYTNRRFATDFCHLPGATLGQFAGEPWASAVNDNTVGERALAVDETLHEAQIEQLEIGGQKHTLIAMSPNRN